MCLPPTALRLLTTAPLTTILEQDSALLTDRTNKEACRKEIKNSQFPEFILTPQLWPLVIFGNIEEDLKGKMTSCSNRVLPGITREEAVGPTSPQWLLPTGWHSQSTSSGGHWRWAPEYVPTGVSHDRVTSGENPDSLHTLLSLIFHCPHQCNFTIPKEIYYLLLLRKIVVPNNFIIPSRNFLEKPLNHQ